MDAVNFNRVRDLLHIRQDILMNLRDIGDREVSLSIYSRDTGTSRFPVSKDWTKTFLIALLDDNLMELTDLDVKVSEFDRQFIPEGL